MQGKSRVQAKGCTGGTVERGTLHHVDGQVVIETDCVVCERDEWPDIAGSFDGEWATLPLGPYVVALRIRGIPGIAAGSLLAAPHGPSPLGG